MTLDKLREHLRPETFGILERADARCAELERKASEILAKLVTKAGVDESQVCFIATGSVGRREALEASDLDFMPVLADPATLAAYAGHDQEIRTRLSEHLGIKVSKGEDLTKPISLSELVDQETIGGDADGSTALTKRVLVLTESSSLGGGLALDDIRGKILHAYAAQERTRGRHVLSLCNDIARYYRTLCVEYKAKIDVDAKDWCTRNAKLRHSRKFWFFSTLVAFATVAESDLHGSDAYVVALKERLRLPPYMRLVDALQDQSKELVWRVLEPYAFFLEFMSDPARRRALSTVDHAARYSLQDGNPFPLMKFNSDLLHYALVEIIEQMPRHLRRRIFDWFLL